MREGIVIALLVLIVGLALWPGGPSGVRPAPKARAPETLPMCLNTDVGTHVCGRAAVAYCELHRFATDTYTRRACAALLHRNRPSRPRIQ